MGGTVSRSSRAERILVDPKVTTSRLQVLHAGLQYRNQA